MVKEKIFAEMKEMFQMEKDSLATFSMSTVNRKERHYSEEKRIALVCREFLYNGHTQGAKNFLIFNFLKDGSHYLAIAHNGKEFESKPHLRECLRPSTSIGSGGVQGIGMKAAMFLLIENSTEAELIIYNKESDKHQYTVKLSCQDLNNANISDLNNSWHEEIMQVMGKEYDKYKVVYLIRYVNEDTKKEKGKGLVTKKSMHLLCEYSRGICEDIEIKAVVSLEYGKIRPTRHQCIDTNQHIFLVHSKKEFDNLFLKDKEEFNIEKISSKLESGRVFLFDAKLEVEIYPNLTNQNDRLLVLNGEHIGEMRELAKNSSEVLFVKCDFNIKSEKDVKRASTDPVYSSVSNFHELATIGIWANKDVQFDAKVKDFWDKEIVDKNSSITWRPIVKAWITITPKDNNLYQKLSWDDFFYVERDQSVREMIKSTFQKLHETQPENLKSLRKRMSSHFPHSKSEFAPLPYDTDTCGTNSVNIIKKIKNQEGKFEDKIITNEKPGTTIEDVVLQYKDGLPVLHDDITFCPDKGLELLVTPDKKKYVLRLSRICKKLDNGDLKELDDETEYEHTPRFLPKRSHFCYIRGQKTWLSIRAEIPLRPYGNGGGRCSLAGMDKSSLKETTDFYKELPEGLIGQLINGELYINCNNVKLKDIIRIQKEIHYDLYSKWVKIYQTAKGIAEKSLGNFGSVEVEFKRSNKQEMYDLYGNEQDWYINTYLEQYFDSAEILKLRNKIEDIEGRTVEQPGFLEMIEGEELII